MFKPGLRKLVSAVTFRLKGGGWYETDFKDEKSRKNVAKDEDKRDAGVDQAGDKKDADAEKKTAPKDSKEPTADSAGKDATEKKAKSGANAVQSTAPAKGAPASAKH